MRGQRGIPRGFVLMTAAGAKSVAMPRQLANMRVLPIIAASHTRRGHLNTMNIGYPARWDLAHPRLSQRQGRSGHELHGDSVCKWPKYALASRVRVRTPLAGAHAIKCPGRPVHLSALDQG